MKRMCILESIAQGAIGRVEFCRDCRVLHVSLEGVILHFKPDGFREFCMTLGMALNRFDLQHEPENSAVDTKSCTKEGVH